MAAISDTRNWTTYINTWSHMVSVLKEREAFVTWYNTTTTKLTVVELEIEDMLQRVERAQISYLENV